MPPTDARRKLLSCEPCDILPSFMLEMTRCETRTCVSWKTRAVKITGTPVGMLSKIFRQTWTKTMSPPNLLPEKPRREIFLLTAWTPSTSLERKAAGT